MIRLIAAIDAERGIGREGQIPWHLPEDLKRFSKLTTGQPIIMGRATAESLPGWLPNRTHIILSRKGGPVTELAVPEKKVRVVYVGSLEQAFKIAGATVWVIGGQQIYEQTIALADAIHLTELTKAFGCDRFFPAVPAEFIPTRVEDFSDHPVYPHKYVVYRRRLSLEEALGR